MLKLFNRKKKDNKGFTLVELVIVVAILAILVGLLAPQYTKYVEKSRKSADASNLEEIVKELKVVASDPQYSVQAGTYTIIMSHTGGTSIAASNLTGTVSTTATELWTAGMDSLLEGDWTIATDNMSMTNTNLKLKSNKWNPGTSIAAVTGNNIGATVVVAADGQMTVTYAPTTLKDGTN